MINEAYTVDIDAKEKRDVYIDGSEYIEVEVESNDSIEVSNFTESTLPNIYCTSITGHIALAVTIALD